MALQKIHLPQRLFKMDKGILTQGLFFQKMTARGHLGPTACIEDEDVYRMNIFNKKYGINWWSYDVIIAVDETSLDDVLHQKPIFLVMVSESQALNHDNDNVWPQSKLHLDLLTMWLMCTSCDWAYPRSWRTYQFSIYVLFLHKQRVFLLAWSSTVSCVAQRTFEGWSMCDGQDQRGLNLGKKFHR